MTTRRRILLALGAAAVARPLLAQTRQKPVVIGYLAIGSGGGPYHEAFKEGLAAHGWREGSGYVIEARWANSEMARLKPLAEELAAKMPAIVVAAPSLT
jgi:hypothetical protein